MLDHRSRVSTFNYSISACCLRVTRHGQRVKPCATADIHAALVGPHLWPSVPAIKNHVYDTLRPYQVTHKSRNCESNFKNSRLGHPLAISFISHKPRTLRSSDQPNSPCRHPSRKPWIYPATTLTPQTYNAIAKTTSTHTLAPRQIQMLPQKCSFPQVTSLMGTSTLMCKASGKSTCGVTGPAGRPNNSNGAN